jgi:ABC-type transport system involved in multi-copper enzyme maturation permease subunit
MTASSPPLLKNWNYRWHAAQSIQRRASQSSFYSLGIYVTMAVSLLISAVTLHNSLRFTEQNFVMLARQPLFLSIFVNTVLTSLFLAMRAALAAARERDQGTLEVLMYGPVDEAAFILGSFFAQLRVYLGVVVVAVVWSNLVTWLLNLQFSWEVTALLLTTVATAAAVIAFGLLLAAWGGRTRATLIYFILISLFVVGVQVADEVVRNLLVADQRGGLNDPLLLLRNALAAINGVVQWVSPYAQLRAAMDALLDHDAGSYLFHLAVTLVQVVVLLGGSILVLRRRGARG